MELKFTIEQNIDKDDLAALNEYFGVLGCEGTFTDFCKRYYETKLSDKLSEWLPKARRYLRTGKTQYEQLRGIVDSKEAKDA